MDDEIRNFIKSYYKTYFTERNYEKVLKHLSPEITVFGTGVHEVGDTPEKTFMLYQKDLEAVPAPIKYSNLTIKTKILTTDLCLVFGTLSIKGKSNFIKFKIPLIRYSFTLRKESGEWKILHGCMSIPNENQGDDELYPLQKIIKQNELLNKKVEERTRELRESIRKHKKELETKDLFFSLISHDIKGPFGNLMGFINILKNQYNEFDLHQQTKFINIISDSADKIFALLDKLLIWSSLQRKGLKYNPGSLNIRMLVQECFSTQIENIQKKNIRFCNKIDDSIMVIGDELMLLTIFRNLISNAVKFTHKNGTITIGIEQDSDEDKNELTFFIEDTGIGMDQEQSERLFNSQINVSQLGTENEQGTGIGLSICKELIDLHGSKINVESEFGNGSRFYFSLKRSMIPV